MFIRETVYDDANVGRVVANTKAHIETSSKCTENFGRLSSSCTITSADAQPHILKPVCGGAAGSRLKREASPTSATFTRMLGMNLWCLSIVHAFLDWCTQAHTQQVFGSAVGSRLKWATPRIYVTLTCMLGILLEFLGTLHSHINLWTPTHFLAGVRWRGWRKEENTRNTKHRAHLRYSYAFPERTWLLLTTLYATLAKKVW